MQLRSIKDVELASKRILMRVDYNVSLGRTLRIVDDTRITRTLDTMHYLLEHGVSSIKIISHLGKPGGKVVPHLSLAPVAEHLSELLGEPVAFNAPGKVSLMENLRFDPREEEGSKQFARELASGCDLYVNEAFGTSHRAATSMTTITTVLPSYAGLGLVLEVNTILGNLESPERPLVVVVGGAKVKDKIRLLEVLANKADTILIGGGMANTFLAALGNNMQESSVEHDQLDFARTLLSSTSKKAQIILPTDLVVGNLESKDSLPITVPVSAVPTGAAALDIGQATSLLFGKVISIAQTIIWNGPLGVFEDPRFASGTTSIYKALTANEPAMIVVGGGDTLTAIKDHTHLSRLDFVSTGGGAMLELIEKGTLPALVPLYQA